VEDIAIHMPTYQVKMKEMFENDGKTLEKRMPGLEKSFKQ
jgi:hypothetical protein